MGDARAVGSPNLVKGYISLAEARATQVDKLAAGTGTIAEQVRAANDAGVLQGPTPILSASAQSLRGLRRRGLDASCARLSRRPSQRRRVSVAVSAVFGVADRHIAERQARRDAIGLQMDRSLPKALGGRRESPIAAISSTNISLGEHSRRLRLDSRLRPTLMALGMIAEVCDDGVIGADWPAAASAARQLEAWLSARIDGLVAPLVRRATRLRATASWLGSAKVGSLLLREIARLPATGMWTAVPTGRGIGRAGRAYAVGEARRIELARVLARAGHETIVVSPVAVSKE